MSNDEQCGTEQEHLARTFGRLTERVHGSDEVLTRINLITGKQDQKLHKYFRLLLDSFIRSTSSGPAHPPCFPRTQGIVRECRWE
jgi:hypothetical protein